MTYNDLLTVVETRWPDSNYRYLLSDESHAGYYVHRFLVDVCTQLFLEQDITSDLAVEIRFRINQLNTKLKLIDFYEDE